MEGGGMASSDACEDDGGGEFCVRGGIGTKLTQNRLIAKWTGRRRRDMRMIVCMCGHSDNLGMRGEGSHGRKRRRKNPKAVASHPLHFLLNCCQLDKGRGT
jgi:hypothetical protein